MISRRCFLHVAAVAPWVPQVVAAGFISSPLGIVIHSYGIRARVERERHFSEPLNFLKFCHARGAGSIQMPLGNRAEDDCARLRERCAELKMGLEGSIRIPQGESDVSRFEAEVRTAKESGAAVLRTVLLSGRRYEVFQELEHYREFEQRSRRLLELARPVLERHHMKLAIENHKDYRAADLAGLLRTLDSPWLGVCVDTGNNLALLEDPHETVKILAPWALSCHLKDMGVRESADGFLLSEVRLGEGFLDIKQIIATLRAANPALRLHLEMITRDPLRIPCLTPGYWATLPELPARHLASALTLVRHNAYPRELPRVSQLSSAEQLAVEDDNVAACMAYARTQLA